MAESVDSVHQTVCSKQQLNKKLNFVIDTRWHKVSELDGCQNIRREQ